jgi:predicted site-specific integrase-resolvase
MNPKKEVQGDTIIDDLRARTTMLTTSEVMALIRVTRATLCGWVRKSLIPATRMPDNSYLFCPAAIASWMEQRTTVTQ